MENTQKLKLKLSIKKDTLRPLTETDLNVLEGVVGGTGGGCTSTYCTRTIIVADYESV
ncbi:hypothetical protein [Archangium sp.]|jgi:hypothetical protein|uniref:hypothetical protein n=1 Tax=Archangium sp. TaxID=1872627 RepID=UPI002EDA17CA